MRRSPHLLCLVGLMLAVGPLTSAEGASFPGELPELGSIGRPNPYPFNWEPHGEVNGAGFLEPESGDPATPGSNSPCWRLDGSDTWELSRTYWYHAGGGVDAPMVLELHAGQNIGLVAYDDPPGAGNPTASDRVGCYGGPGSFAGFHEIVVPAGEQYALQVGVVAGSEPGIDQAWNLRGELAAGNDAPENAIELPSSAGVEVWTFGATVEPVERSAGCNLSFGAGRSVWVKKRVVAPGSLVVDARSTSIVPSNASLALYDASATTLLACADPPFGPVIGTQLSHPVEAGTYLIRVSSGTPLSSDKETWQGWWLVTGFVIPVDGDEDGYYRPADCRDTDPTIHPGSIDLPENGVDEDCNGADAVNFDRDGDGHQRPSDCDDGDRAIHPGAMEAEDDGVDQNCDGRDNRKDSDRDGIADYQDDCPKRSSGGIDSDHDGCRDPIQLLVTARFSLALVGDRLELDALTVRAGKGVRVVVTCTRGACRRTSKRLRQTTVAMDGGFGPTVPEGARVTIAATKPGAIGMVKRYRLSSAGVRLVGRWCTSPGSRARRIACA